MRDMKARSMGKANRTRSSTASQPSLGAARARALHAEERSPFEEDDEACLDELEPAVLVDQGDGMHVSVRGFDGGGDDGFELPDEAPPGWE